MHHLSMPIECARVSIPPPPKNSPSISRHSIDSNARSSPITRSKRFTNSDSIRLPHNRSQKSPNGSLFMAIKARFQMFWLGIAHRWASPNCRKSLAPGFWQATMIHLSSTSLCNRPNLSLHSTNLPSNRSFRATRWKRLFCRHHRIKFKIS